MCKMHEWVWRIVVHCDFEREPAGFHPMVQANGQRSGMNIMEN